MGKASSKPPAPPSYSRLKVSQPLPGAPLRQCLDDMLDAIASGNPTEAKNIYAAHAGLLDGCDLSKKINNTMDVVSAAAPAPGPLLAAAAHDYHFLHDPAEAAKLLEAAGVNTYSELVCAARTATPAEHLQADIDCFYRLMRTGNYAMAQTLACRIKSRSGVPHPTHDKDELVCAAQRALDNAHPM